LAPDLAWMCALIIAALATKPTANACHGATAVASCDGFGGAGFVAIEKTSRRESPGERFDTSHARATEEVPR